ncbi:ABC transporter ATP-binding protein, partial [bacterium]|nr:ABC transporter ATP-binding protein [bacterium]
EDLQVLKGVDIDITKGEIVSIIGKSGAGKSTLLHIVGTLDHSDAGTIVINGVDTTRLNKKNLAKFRNETIGFVFQFHHLLNEFTALENVTIPAHIQGTNATEAEKKAKELLDYLGLGDRMEHKPQELSGGEQQRVAVARALINDPAVIFADEPTGNLDASSSDDLHNLFKKLQSEMGQTFLIVTHNQELAKLSDRTLTMQDGRIIS